MQVVKQKFNKSKSAKQQSSEVKATKTKETVTSPKQTESELQQNQKTVEVCKDRSFHSVEIQTSFIDVCPQTERLITPQDQDSDSEKVLEDLDVSWKDRVVPFLENDFNPKPDTQSSVEDLHLALESDRGSLTSVQSAKTIDRKKSYNENDYTRLGDNNIANTELVSESEKEPKNTDKAALSDRSEQSAKSRVSKSSGRRISERSQEPKERKLSRGTEKNGLESELPNTARSDKSHKSDKSRHSDRSGRSVEKERHDLETRSERSDRCKGQRSRSDSRNEAVMSDTSNRSEGRRSGKSDRSVEKEFVSNRTRQVL